MSPCPRLSATEHKCYRDAQDAQPANGSVGRRRTWRGGERSSERFAAPTALAALGVSDGYTGTPSPGPAVSGRHLRCAAIWCGTSSIRQWTPTCAMVMAGSTVQAAGRTGDEEALWPSGRRPATDLGPQDLPGRRVARCAVSRRRRVVVRAVGRDPARWPRGRDEHRILARDRTRSVGCHRRSPGAVPWPDDIAA
jgi:hypothetical protein